MILEILPSLVMEALISKGLEKLPKLINSFKKCRNERDWEHELKEIMVICEDDKSILEREGDYLICRVCGNKVYVPFIKASLIVICEQFLRDVDYKVLFQEVLELSKKSNINIRITLEQIKNAVENIKKTIVEDIEKFKTHPRFGLLKDIRFSFSSNKLLLRVSGMNKFFQYKLEFPEVSEE